MEKGVLRILFLILSLFFIIISYIIFNQILRIILLILGILLLVISNVIDRYHKKFAIIFYTFFSLFIMQFIDYLGIKYFNKKPLLVYNIREYKNIKIYDSLFYRVWQCDVNQNKFLIDDLYKIGYFCDMNDIHSTNINNYAVELVTNYDKYSQTNIKVDGIIYDINDEFVTLKSYIYHNEKLVFNNNLTLKFNINDSFKDLGVGQQIVLIGKIIAKDDKIIYLENCSIL